MKLCKNCNKEFNPCHKTSEFCSKSCATSWRNKQKVKDGTHNFNKIDRSSLAKSRLKNGTHPLLKENMSKESLEKKHLGIKLARIDESRRGVHPWQNPKNWIDNEFSRSKNVVKKRNLDYIELYMSDCEYDGYFKIGWTYNTDMRYWDSRTHEVKNAVKIKSGNPNDILEYERLIKKKFFNENISKELNSTEIFPNNIKSEVLEFVKSL